MRRLSGRRALAALLVGAVAGVILWGGFHTALELTNTQAFCISCHEMKDNVYAEYSKTAHFSNRTGVRATCPDCHVPREWGPKVWRKIQASNELYHHLMGSIDTAEKFNDKRRQLAENVWAGMLANDSRECRQCHTWDAMDPHKQTARSREKMDEGRRKGQTCIECHKGVAHALPKRDD